MKCRFWRHDALAITYSAYCEQTYRACGSQQCFRYECCWERLQIQTHGFFALSLLYLSINILDTGSNIDVRSLNLISFLLGRLLSADGKCHQSISMPERRRQQQNDLTICHNSYKIATKRIKLVKRKGTQPMAGAKKKNDRTGSGLFWCQDGGKMCSNVSKCVASFKNEFQKV